MLDMMSKNPLHSYKGALVLGQHQELSLTESACTLHGCRYTFLTGELPRTPA